MEEINNHIGNLRNLEHPQSPHFLVLIIILFCFMLFAWLMTTYRNQVKQIFASALSENQKMNMERIDSETVKKVGVYLNILYFVTIGLIVYALNYRYNIIESQNLLNYFIINLLIALGFLFKFFIHKAIGWVFNKQELTNHYLSDSYYKFKLFGALALPMVLLILFAPNFYHYIAILVVMSFVFLWLLKCIKGIIYSYQEKTFSLVYSFLYICTLEILPFFIIGKVFNVSFESFQNILF